MIAYREQNKLDYYNFYIVYKINYKINVILTKNLYTCKYNTRCDGQNQYPTITHDFCVTVTHNFYSVRSF